jgi:integrase
MPDEMIQDVLDVAPKWAKGPWFLMVATGARPIELKRLEWRDVDFSKRVLRYWSLKGDGSLRERWVAMPSNVLEFAQAQFDQARRDFRAQPGSPVFVTPTGKRLNSKSLARLLRRITTELGIDGYVAYGFRHRFVTRGRRQGMDTADVGKIVGHSSANTTSGYDHTDAEDLREMMEKVNRGNPKLRG